MPSNLPGNILFIDLEPANRAPGFDSHWSPDTRAIVVDKRYVKLENETRSSLGLVSKDESFLTSPTWLNSRALGELIEVKFGSNITETFIVQMHPLTADCRLAWVEDTTQRFDNRVAHWMIKLGHKYSDNIGYWHRQQSKSCPAGTLRPRGLLRQEHDGSTPTFTSTPDASQTLEDDATANDDDNDSPSDTNRWADIAQFARDYITKKKTLADAPKLKCCICQEKLYYARFNSRRGDRQMEAACITQPCGHIIGAMCHDKWHVGCLIRDASFENEDDDDEEGGGGYRLGTMTCPL